MGGVETIVRQVSTELATRGHEVHVLSSTLNTTTRKEVSRPGIEEKDGVIIHKLPASRLRVSHAQFLKGLKDSIVDIQPDIVHSHNLHPHLFQLIKWKSKNDYKLVCEPHYPIANIESNLAKIMVPITLNYLASKSSAIDLFIAHAEIERNWLTKNGVDTKKISTILFPFVSNELIKYKRRTKLDNSGDLLFIGRVVPIKGIHVLIEAMNIRRNIDQTFLTIVGPCQKKYLEYLYNFIKQKKLGDKIKIKGVVSDEEKYELMLSHKALILPSLGDFTPGVLIESQAIGLPVIATKVGAVPEIVHDGITGILVKAGDSEELSKAIANMLSNPEQRKKMSNNAKQYSQKFMSDIVINKLEKTYRCILN